MKKTTTTTTTNSFHTLSSPSTHLHTQPLFVFFITCLLLCVFTSHTAADGFTGFNYLNFNNISMLSTVANVEQGPGGTLSLSTAQPNSFGAAWYVNKVQVRGFTTSFSFTVTDSTTPEGFAFVIELQSLTALGALHSGMGYGDPGGAPTAGIMASVAVEFDMHQNVELGDANSNHICIHSNGLLQNNANETYRIGSVGTGIPNLSRANNQNVTITYDPIHQGGYMEVIMAPNDGPSLSVTGLSFQSMLQLDAATGSAWVGFTAAATAVLINSWSFSYTGVADPVNSVVTGTNNVPYAGQVTAFYVQTVDQFGYNMTADMTQFSVWLTEASGRVTNVIQSYQGNGLYAFPYNATSSGIASFNATVNGLKMAVSPFSLTVVPGAVDASRCVAWGDDLDTSTMIAGNTGTFFIQLYDAFSNNISTPLPDGQSFQVTFTYGAIVVPAVINYSANGIYVGTYTLTIVGTYTVSVLLQALPIRNPTHLVQVSPATLAPSNGIAFGGALASDTVAGVIQTTYVQIRDMYGNNITQVSDPSTITVELILELNQNVNFTGAPMYTADGVWSITYNVTVSGLYALAASVNAQNVVGGDNAAVTVVPTYMWPGACLAYGTGATYGIAGALTVFYVQIRDVFGNNIAAPVVGNNVAAVLSGGALGENTTLPCNVTYTGNGIYSATYNLTIATQYNIYVSVTNSSITQPTNAISLIPAATYAPNSEAYGEGLTANGIAGEIHTFQLQLRDYFFNNITTAQPVNILARLTGSTTNSIIDASITYNATLLYYVAYYNVTVVDTYTMNISIDAVDIRNTIHTVAVAPAPLAPIGSVAFGELAVNGLAGDAHTLYVQLRDVFQNNITVVPNPLAINVSVALTSLTNNEVATVSYVALGVYVATYNITRAENYNLNIVINSAPIVNPQYPVTVSPNVVYPPHCFSEGAGLNESVAGDIAEFMIYLHDVYFNQIILAQTPPPLAVLTDSNQNQITADITHDDVTGDYTGNYNLTVTGQYTLHISINGNDILDPTSNVLVVPSSLNVLHTTAAGGAVTDGVAGVTGTFVIQLRDVFDNPITYYTEVTSAVVTITTPGLNVPVAVATATLGTYTAQYTTTLATTYTTSVQINGADISGSPFTTTILYNTYNLPNTLSTGMAPLVVAGYSSSFNVQLRDVYGNNVTGYVVPTEQLLFELVPLANSPLPKYTANFTFSLGIYYVTYYVITSGRYNVTLNVTGEGGLGGLPVPVRINPDVTYPPLCQLSDGYDKAIVKVTTQFTVFAKDRFSNQRNEGGDDVMVTLTAAGVETVQGTVADNHDGTYAVSYFLHDKASYTLSVQINGTSVGETPPRNVDAEYANNPVPTLLIVACVLGGGIVLAVAGFFIYRRYNRVRYELLE